MRHVLPLILLLGLSRPTAQASNPRGPRLAAREDLLEVADGWLYEFDENEDEHISIAEMAGVINQLMEQTSMPGHVNGALTPQLLMGQADADGDGQADRSELVDLLMRMKGFDAGHVSREEAQKPTGASGSADHAYAKSHAERMDRAARGTKRSRTAKGNAKGKGKAGGAPPKDEP